MLEVGLLVAGIGLLAWGLTGAVRRYAVRQQLLDTPNARSSHRVTTPRGGGLSIVLAFMAGLLIGYAAGWLSASTVWLFLPALLVAGVGFWDDHGHVPARWRLGAQAIAVAWALFLLGGAPEIRLGPWLLPWPELLVWLGGIWLINLYNFMDGIDGIASVEALCVLLGLGLAYGVAGAVVWEALLPMSLLAVAIAGFLLWNLPPARIFMGDVGSGFLGQLMLLLLLQAAVVHEMLFWSGLILLGVFVVDASLTLLRRLLRGERVYLAHRQHAYQHMARRLGRHGPVTLGVLGLNLCWLLPWALAVAAGILPGWLGCLVAWLPLLLLGMVLGSGRPEGREQR